MKDETLGAIILGSYTALCLSWAVLYTNRIITNNIEDKTAVAKINVYEGNLISNVRVYVAFDKSNKCEIDEIREDGISLVGSRALAAVPYTRRYHKENREFEHVMKTYFNNIHSDKCL